MSGWMRWPPPPEAQPVAWICRRDSTFKKPWVLIRGEDDGADEVTIAAAKQRGWDVQPLYAHPPPSAPVGVERKYPDDGNGDDDAYNRGWNDCLDALAQQPPAEAQEPRDREADRARFRDEAFNAWLDTVISDAGHTVWDTIGDLAAAWAGWQARPDTPPSAPVGVVEPLSLLRAGHWREVYVGHRCMRLEVTYEHAAWERLMEQVDAALAQQPAPVAPVGVEGLVGNWQARAETERAESKNKEWDEWLRENHAGAAAAFATCASQLEQALAQQPAAVDSEMVTRAVNAYDEATGEGWQMPCLQGMRAALTAALRGHGQETKK